MSLLRESEGSLQCEGVSTGPEGSLLEGEGVSTGLVGSTLQCDGVSTGLAGRLPAGGSNTSVLSEPQIGRLTSSSLRGSVTGVDVGQSPRDPFLFRFLDTTIKDNFIKCTVFDSPYHHLGWRGESV